MITRYASTSVRRRQIVSAARKLIAKHGSEHLTVKRIASEIGVSEGAIYRHFKSKREIISFLVDEIEKLILADIERSFRDLSPKTEEVLEKIIKAHISAVERRSGMTFQIIAEIISLGDKKLNKKIHGVINKYISRIGDVLARGRAAGVVREDLDLEAAAMLFFGMIQGLISVWALDHYGFDLEEKYGALWRVYRKVISSPAVPAPLLANPE
ncbi:MAG: TetR/AcrR family transcriptional regulator [Chloroflexi bacterium]|nr:TetR/AcrR family transcriptional regulator [Chloroflexota bacterium]